MKIVQVMKPEDIKKALEGHKDIITPALKEHEQYFKRLSCHHCGGDVMPIIDPKSGLFRPGAILPNYLAKCNICGCEFEPYTRLDVTLPKTST